MEAKIKEIIPDRGNLNIKVDYIEGGKVVGHDQFYIADKEELVTELKSNIQAKMSKNEVERTDAVKKPEKVTASIKSKNIQKNEVIKIAGGKNE
jgi:hypothetical protein